MNSRTRTACVLLALALTGGVERKSAKLNNDANKLFEEKKFEDAVKLYDEAQTRSPETPEIPYNLGNTLYRQGRIPDALGPLQRGAQSEDPVIRQRSLYNLGNALHDVGKLKESVSAYRQALVLDPTDRDAKINYEKALLEMEKQQQQQQQSGQDKNQQQNQQNQGKGDQQQQQSQSGENDPNQKPEDSQQNQAQSQDGESKDQDPKQLPNEQEQQQMAALDSVPAGELSREEAQRILEAMRQQENELQKEKARQQKIRSRRVEKDW